MRKIGHIVSFLIPGIVLLVSCSSSKKQDKEKENPDPEREALYADTLSEGNIIVVTDTAILNEINRHIAAQKKLLELEREENMRGLSLSERYLEGDTSVRRGLIEILKSDDARERANIYTELSPYRVNTQNVSPGEQELYNTILNNINLREDEGNVIEWAGNARVPGYTKAFEDRLFSGKSAYENELLFRLSLNSEGCTPKALNRLIKKIRSRELKGQELERILNTLNHFAQNGSNTIKKTAGAFAFEIYSKLLIDKMYFNEMGNTTYIDSPGEYVVQLMSDFGGPECLPILEHQLKMGVKQKTSLDGLVRLDKKTAAVYIMEFLDDPRRFTHAERPAMDLYAATNNKELAKALFAGFEKTVLAIRQDPDKDYEHINLMYFIMQCYETGGKKLLDMGMQYINDSDLKKKFKKAIDHTLLTGYDMARDLYQMAVVSKPYETAFIEKARKEDSEYEYDKGQFDPIDFLERSGICTYAGLDYEYAATDYDTLIKQILANSGGLIQNIEVFTESWSGLHPYTITIIYNNKAYIAKTHGGDEQNSCDIDLVLKLVNRLIQEEGLGQRYIRMEVDYDYILFGDTTAVRNLYEKYFIYPEGL